MTAAAFDVTGALPTGTTLLEASAGTGKTWTIASLVTRYVAEGHCRLDELLVVTFGRAASEELNRRTPGCQSANRAHCQSRGQRRPRQAVKEQPNTD